MGAETNGRETNGRGTFGRPKLFFPRNFFLIFLFWFFLLIFLFWFFCSVFFFWFFCSDFFFWFFSSDFSVLIFLFWFFCSDFFFWFFVLIFFQFIPFSLISEQGWAQEAIVKHAKRKKHTNLLPHMVFRFSGTYISVHRHLEKKEWYGSTQLAKTEKITSGAQTSRAHSSRAHLSPRLFGRAHSSAPIRPRPLVLLRGKRHLWRCLTLNNLILLFIYAHFYSQKYLTGCKKRI